MEIGWDSEGFSIELLLKVPKDKPPVVGLIFTRVKEACEWNQDLINDYPNLPYFLKFINKSSKGITFEIGSEKLPGKRLYKDVKYDRIKLENFLYITQSMNVFTFTHLLYDFDQYFVVKTLDKYKKFDLKVERVYMLG